MKSTDKKGKIYLVPTPLIEGNIAGIPEHNCSLVSRCTYFVVETPKTGRRHVKAMAPEKVLSECQWMELNKHTAPQELESLLNPALDGHDICLLSDAGSPTIADPGAPLIALAHRAKVQVVPLTGPSAIMLAMMGSGFHGQTFTFHGYLSPKKPELKNELRQIERQANQGATQIFMETPYRNQQILEVAFETLHPETLLCIACEITGPDEFIRTQSIGQWNKQPTPDLHKRPCIFLLGR